MTTDFNRRLTDLMLPHVSNLPDRKSLLTEAFAFDPSAAPIIGSITLDGSPRNFCTSVINNILQRDCQLFKPLLEALQALYGVSKEGEIEALISMVPDVCRQHAAGLPEVASADTPIADPLNAYTLRVKMNRGLQMDDIRTIVLDLNPMTNDYLDFDNLRGDQKSSKLRSLISWLEKRRSLPILINYLRNSKEFSHILD